MSVLQWEAQRRVRARIASRIGAARAARNLVVLGTIVCFAGTTTALAHVSERRADRLAGTGASTDRIDVEAYDVTLRFDDALQSVEVVTVLDLRWREAGDALRLDLSSPGLEAAAAGDGSPAAGLVVETVESWKSTASGDGNTEAEWSALAHRHESDVLSIELASVQPAGSRSRLRISTHGRPRDGLVFGQNRDGEAVVFADHWPDRARHWIPSVDHPSDKALFSFDIEAPIGVRGVAVGQLVEERILPSGQRHVARWRTPVPIPTKVAVVGLARFRVRHEPPCCGGVAISSWVYPDDETALRNLAVAPRVLADLVELFGPFPYSKLANVQSTTRYGGMENAGAIFYGEAALGGEPERVETLIAHEMAHQWFGDAVTEASWRDVWLSEGFATYGAALYLEQSRGDSALAETMRRTRERLVRHAREHPEAVVRPGRVPDDLRELLGAHTYQKGAWILHMMRQRLGDTVFFEAIRQYLRNHLHGNATTEDLFAAIRYASERHGSSADALALETETRRWLEEPGVPRIDGSWRWHEGRVELRFLQSGLPSPRRLPLEISVVPRPTSGVVDAGLPDTGVSTIELPAAAEQIVVIDHPTPVDDVVLDPHVRLLFELGHWGAVTDGIAVVD